MIYSFVLDYMHLICIGIVKKTLVFWVLESPKNKKCKLSSRAINDISTDLKAISKFFPRDFNRKIRGLDSICFWKATELRTFLLYTGPVVLKGRVSDAFYNHFMMLSIATSICISKQNLHLLDIAERLFKEYVDMFKTLYGRGYVSYNVHNLVHIVDDVRNFGPLDNFSCFPFENKLGMIKKLLHSGYLPLQQVAKRIMEHFKHDVNKLGKDECIEGIQSNCYSFEGSMIDSSSNNQWFLTSDKKICRFKRAEVINNQLFITSKVLKSSTPFFDLPICST